MKKICGSVLLYGICLLASGYSQETLATTPKITFTEVLIGKPPIGADLDGFVICSNGKKVAFIQGAGDLKNYFSEGKKTPGYVEVKNGEFNFDGTQFAFFGKKPSNKWVFSFNDKEGSESEYSGFIKFSPDGKRVAYSMADDQKYFVVIDGKSESATVGTGTVIEKFVFSQDSKQYAYTIQQGGQFFVVLNGKKQQKGYSSINNVKFSPDSKKLGFIAFNSDNNTCFVVVDGVASPSFKKIEDFIFHPDSKQIAYIAEKGEKSVVIYKDEESDPWASVSDLVFSADGTHFGYIGESKSKGMSYFVMDGKIQRENLSYHAFPKIKSDYTGTEFDIASDPIVSPNFKNISYILMQKSRRTIETNGVLLWEKENYKFDLIEEPTYSPDGSILAFIGRDDKNFLCANGFKSEGIGKLFFNRIVFTSPKTFFTCGIRGSSIYRFEGLVE